MGGYTGKYSRNPFSTFDEEKNYAFSLLQEGVPVTDDDWNANSLALLTRARRGNQLFGNYGTPNDGFRVQEATSNVNNFKITGGGPTNTDIEASGRFFMRGYSCILLKDADYINALSNLSQQSIHPRVTKVYYDGTNTVVEDSAAKWVIDELRTLTTGRQVVIGSVTYDIDSNSVDAMKLLPLGVDHTLAVSDGDFYRLTLTTPSANRQDAVYLNLYIDEYDGNDDPAIDKRIGGEEIEAMLQAKVIQALFVREDVPTNGELTDYVDSDGNQHFVFKLATLNRTAASAITTAMIVDLVPTIGFQSIGLSNLAPLKAIPASPVDDTVYVTSGQALNTYGDEVVVWIGGTSPTISPVSPGNTRWDAVVLRDDATLDIVQGVETVGTPAKPEVNGTPIAFVFVDESATVLINEADIVDARSLFTPGHGWKILSPSAGTLVQQLADLDMSDGDRFWMTPGTYSIGGALTINQKIHLKGSNGSTLVYGVGDSISVSADHVILEGFHIESDQNINHITVTSTRCHIKDIFFNWTGVAAGTAGSFIFFNGLSSPYSYLTVTQCFTGFDSYWPYAGIVIDGETEIYVVGCEFRVTGNGLGFGGNTRNAKISRSRFVSEESPAISIYGGVGEGIEDLYLTDCDLATNTTSPTFLGNANPDLDQCHIENCHFNNEAQRPCVDFNGMYSICRITNSFLNCNSIDAFNYPAIKGGGSEVSLTVSNSQIRAWNGGSPLDGNTSTFSIDWQFSNCVIEGPVVPAADAYLSFSNCTFNNAVTLLSANNILRFTGCRMKQLRIEVSQSTVHIDGCDFIGDSINTPIRVGNGPTQTISLIYLHISNVTFSTFSPTIPAIDVISSNADVTMDLSECRIVGPTSGNDLIRGNASASGWSLHQIRGVAGTLVNPNGGDNWSYDGYALWEGGQIASGPYAGRTVYQAPCDIVVHCYSTYGSNPQVVGIYASPTSFTYPGGFILSNLRVESADLPVTNGLAAGGVTSAIKKGEYWGVNYYFGTPAGSGVYIFVMRKGGQGAGTPSADSWPILV